MNTQWRELLQHDGAVFDGDEVLNFGDELGERRAARSGIVLAELSAWGFIAASGADAESFLQGQLANDVKALTPKLSQLSAYCSPKGRILASMRIVRRDKDYLLRVPRTTLEATLKRLRMFVLRSKVELTDLSDSVVSLGLAGEQAPARISSALGDVPVELDSIRATDGITVVRVPGLTPRYECYGEPTRLGALWQQLREGATTVSSATWAWLDIMAGVPRVLPNTVDSFVPQMLNLQAIGGLSFTKGCYPGQEIVARMQYLGKLKRRMFLARLDSSRLPLPGDELVVEGKSDVDGSGMVVDAEFDVDGVCHCLYVAQIEKAEAGALRLLEQPEAMLQNRQLPYPISAST